MDTLPSMGIIPNKELPFSDKPGPGPKDWDPMMGGKSGL